MKRQQHEKFIRAILAATVSAALAPNALAQTAATTEKIEVTGSSIKRVEGETALPVTVMSRDQIEKSGATTPMELLQIISANNSLGNVSLTTTIGALTLSAQTASLRGLQGGHTLVLVNGKRVNGFAGEVNGVQGVNLAIIPFAAIERVEILKDGASAVYGSDAIAGVINFIMRSDYDGAEASVYYGAPTRSGGGAQDKYTASLGFGDLAKDRYNVFFNASYDHQRPLEQKDRDFSNDSTERFLDIGGFGGSSNTFPGRITTGRIGIPGHTPPDCGRGPNVFVNRPDDAGIVGCFYDPSREAGVESIPDDKNANFFVQGKYQINPGWQAYAHGLYGEDKTHIVIQPVPISDAFQYGLNNQPATVLIRPDSPFYPHAEAAAAGIDGQPLNVRYRAFESGLRDTTDTNKGFQVVGGVKGTVADRWDTDLSYSYAEGKTAEHVNGGFPLYSRILPLLNSGTVNLFGPNTPEIIDQLRAANFTGDVFTGKATVSSVNGKVSGDLFNLPAGTAAGAIGVDLRKEKLTETPADAFIAGDISGYGGSAGAIDADRNVKAAFLEMNVPLLRALELDAAVRTDDYSDFGRTNNPKFSLRFQPTRDLLLRTSYGTGFLAPSLFELDSPLTSGVSVIGLNDPVRCPTTRLAGTDCQAQFPITLGGNHELRPEKSEQFTFGVVIEPTNAFSVSADYFKIRLNNVITNGVPVTTILADKTAWGQFITRGPVDPNFPNLPGPIVDINQQFLNLGAEHIEGIDVEAHYRWPQTAYGRIRLDVSGTYYTRYDFQDPSGAFYAGAVSNSLNQGVQGVIPRWKHYASLTWDRGPWTATIANTYQASYTDVQLGLDGNPRTVGSMSLWDLQGSYTGLEHWIFTLGAKNVLDTNPPATNQQNGFQAGYDPSYYDARARFVYGSIKYSFR